MSYTPKNPNGQATMANSQPVTIASNQSTQTVAPPVDNTFTGTITANGGTVTTTPVAGMGGWTMAYYGTYATGATLVMEASFDGGTTYTSVRMLQGSSGILGYVILIAAVSNSMSYFTADIPAGATHLRVRCSAWAAPTGTINIIIGQSVERYATPVATQSASVTGTVNHDAVDSAAPVKIGGKAYTANPTAVANLDRSDAITDKLGKLVSVSVIRELKVRQFTTLTSSTTETTILTAGAAGVFHDVYLLHINNMSATACEVLIRDATGGSVIGSYSVPAGDVRGFNVGASEAEPQATAANNWTAQCVTSVASIKIKVLAVKNL